MIFTSNIAQPSTFTKHGMAMVRESRYGIYDVCNNINIKYAMSDLRSGADGGVQFPVFNQAMLHMPVEKPFSIW